MRKLVILLVSALCVVLFYFTLSSFIKVFHYDLTVPAQSGGTPPRYRLVLITQELDTPFWNKVGTGALQAAKQNGAGLEVWGSYGKNREDFLKKIEIAIASHVDGIIVQGLEEEEFNRLTTVKAAEKGIPVITVANDVPMEESLRRTYVGSDHYKAGQMIGRRLLSDMGTAGHVVLMGSNREEDYQRRRISGILDILKAYPNIRTEVVTAGETREEVVQKTNEIMNKEPNVDAFIAVAANNAGAMIQEIDKRAKVEKYHVYSFDDSPETLRLLKLGKIDALIEQSPDRMGELSVKLMIQWLKGESFPLDYNGYFTDIRMLRAEDLR
ncbi:substrate-binding domain-containing protein [Cohnella sp. CFH 77786]|uniref:substrate-binding domain-containing protein n=1 Tax=Cohnella sp. CFH 77786 TaxID=2662265 RepID=UPI001C6105C4|nr:substrate-binding domain-containing protein [Cohnella sp. CFH 77786]MBW5447946.1 substrate-binding domain-containing protein [Cohnella sp. CFH 77786]